MRTIVWSFAGLLLGLIIHIVIVLSMPILAQDGVWRYLSDLDAFERFQTLDAPQSGELNFLRLDPELIYAVCRLDLSQGPGIVSGSLPDSFWSVSVFDGLGNTIYGTTSRAGSAHTLQLGIFNGAQTRLLAEQQLSITEGLLIVEARRDDIFVVVRVAPVYSVLRDRYAISLDALTCGHA